MLTFALALTLLTGGPETWKTELVAGGDQAELTGPATRIKLSQPFGTDYDADGNLLICEFTGNRVRRIGRDGVMTVLGGDGRKAHGGNGGPALTASFDGMHHLLVHGAAVIVADTWNDEIRRIDLGSGLVEALAGRKGAKGFGGDGGPAKEAIFHEPYSIALDPDGVGLFVIDLKNRRLRRIDLKAGTIATVAGNGKSGRPKDGARAAESPLVDPRAVAVGKDGRVWILERGGHALRVLEKDGTIRTVAGTGKAGNGGDGGPALAASLNGPKHVTVDRDGSVLIADTENHRIRRYDPASGTVTAFCGSGTKGRAGLGGSALKVELNKPHGVTIAPDGSVIIADSSNDRVIRVVRN
jgi:DNA-binding beta-propeller fold protein YncE